MRILIVEDEMLLALQIEEDLVRAGHEVVGMAESLPAALRLAAREEPEVALVDVFLGDHPEGLKVAAELVRRSMLVLFLTGSPRRIPHDFAGAVGVIEKPYTPAELTGALAFLMNAASVGAPPPPLPSSLRLAPSLKPDEDGRYLVGRRSD